MVVQTRPEENIGRDLKFDGDLGVTNTGDLSTITGRDNLRQRLHNRLVTVPGALVHRPTFGIGIQQYIDAKPDLNTLRQLALKVADQFAQDKDVIEVTQVQVTPDKENPSRFSIIVRYNAVGYNEVEDIFGPFGSIT